MSDAGVTARSSAPASGTGGGGAADRTCCHRRGKFHLSIQPLLQWTICITPMDHMHHSNGPYASLQLTSLSPTFSAASSASSSGSSAALALCSSSAADLAAAAADAARGLGTVTGEPSTAKMTVVLPPPKPRGPPCWLSCCEAAAEAEVEEEAGGGGE